MSKVIFEFELPEEREECSIAFHAAELHAAAWDFRNVLRRKLKYEELSKEEDEIYQHVWERFHDSFGDLLDM